MQCAAMRAVLDSMSAMQGGSMGGMGGDPREAMMERCRAKVEWLGGWAERWILAWEAAIQALTWVWASSWVVDVAGDAVVGADLPRRHGL
jgi:hypothetical protein